MPYGLVLFAKDVEPSLLQQTMEEIQGKLNSVGIDMKVVDSSAWFNHSFSRFGSFESWIYETVVGTDYATRKHRFDAFFVTGEGGLVGLATAQIVSLALTQRRPILRWESSSFKPISGVAPNPENDSTFIVS